MMGQLISRLVSYFSKPKSTASSSSNIPATTAAGTDTSATASAPATSATGEKVYSWLVNNLLLINFINNVFLKYLF